MNITTRNTHFISERNIYEKKSVFNTAITTAIITSLLLTSCQSGRTTSTDNPDSNVQNSSVSEAESKADNSEAKKSLRTVTEIPSGELSDTDKFLSGTWIDENGFVANFTDKGRAAIFFR